jgi:hypothetical protein
VRKPTYSLTFPFKLELETCEILSLVLIGDGGLDGGRGRWLELMAPKFETSAVVNFGYYGRDFNIDNFGGNWPSMGITWKPIMGRNGLVF